MASLPDKKAEEASLILELVLDEVASLQNEEAEEAPLILELVLDEVASLLDEVAEAPLNRYILSIGDIDSLSS